MDDCGLPLWGQVLALLFLIGYLGLFVYGVVSVMFSKDWENWKHSGRGK